MVVIKLFGLPRTCTNVVEVVLKTNFKGIVLWTNFPCWKHGENTFKGRVIKRKKTYHHPAVDTDDMKFVICTKDPYDWLISLYRFETSSKRQRKTFDDFLRKPSWHYRNEEGDNDPITKFNKLTYHWLTMFDDPTAVQQFKAEDMKNNQIPLLENIEKQFDLTRRHSDLQVVKKRIAPGAKITNEKFKKVEMQITKKQRKYINTRLDPKVLEVADYSLKNT